MPIDVGGELMARGGREGGWKRYHFIDGNHLIPILPIIIPVINEND